MLKIGMEYIKGCKISDKNILSLKNEQAGRFGNGNVSKKIN